MSTNCPNCLRPVRSGVNYCGYCGASLVPTPDDPAPTIRHSSRSNAKAMAQPAGKTKRVKKSKTSSRSWLKFPITMLVLVILAAMAIRYWPQILVLLGQAAVILKLT
jgi:hypothetical protein